MSVSAGSGVRALQNLTLSSISHALKLKDDTHKDKKVKQVCAWGKEKSSDVRKANQEQLVSSHISHFYPEFHLPTSYTYHCNNNIHRTVERSWWKCYIYLGWFMVCAVMLDKEEWVIWAPLPWALPLRLHGNYFSTSDWQRVLDRAQQICWYVIC